MEGLTDRQASVLDFLKDFIGAHGYPPTVREIGEHFSFNFPAARGHLQALERKGHVTLRKGASRGIEVHDMMGIGDALGDGHTLSLPLVGEIRAGRPLLARQEYTERICVDRTLFQDEEAFTLRVVGESMRDAGIYEGDYVIVRPGVEVLRGEIGIALVEEEEATVKRIYQEGDRVRLVPENSEMSPMEYPASDVRIIGKVVGVIRKL